MDSYEENRVPDITREEIIDSLFIFFPDIKEQEVKFLYHGTSNVFEVKEHYIFRFPDKVFRNPSGVDLIQNEVKMLNHICNYVSISIPEPIYISIEPDFPFVGYEKIPGISLSTNFNQIPKSEKIKITKEIYDPAADFLFYDEGDFFLNQILEIYQGKLDSNFKERMQFLFRRTCLPYIEFGLENDLPDMVNAGLEMLKSKMNL